MLTLRLGITTLSGLTLLLSACGSSARAPADETAQADGRTAAAQATIASAAEHGLPPEQEIAARATLVAAATAGLVPDGIVIATATLDLREALTPEDAATILRRERALDAILSAVAAGDTDSLLGLTARPMWKCGGRADDGCPPGIVPGTLVPKILVGGDFYVSAETLRPTLELLLRGEPLALHFASQSRSKPTHYLLGFEGPAKGNGLPPLVDPAASLNGIFLTVDLSSAGPVVQIDLIVDGGSAARAGYDRTRDSDQRIIVFVERP